MRTDLFFARLLKIEIPFLLVGDLQTPPETQLVQVGCLASKRVFLRSQKKGFGAENCLGRGGVDTGWGETREEKDWE